MEFKIRASKAYEIMAEPKGKGEVLSVGAKSYCKRWLLEQIYGRLPMYSKYTEKGKMVEDDAIKFLNPFFEKNWERKEDEFFTGEADIIDGNQSFDTKCPWSHETFPILEDFIPKNDCNKYMFQGYIYMHLWGLDRHTVAYILMNTPTELDRCALDYSHVDRNNRIKEFSFDYDASIIEALQKKVEHCREYIETLLTNLER